MLALAAALLVAAGPPAPVAHSRPQRPGKVYLNTATHIFHCNSCKWAKACHDHCVPVTEAEARRQGARPCKVCHGRCVRPPPEEPRPPPGRGEEKSPGA